MGDLLQSGAAWLDQQRHAHMARPVTYSRAGDAVELQATVGATTISEEDDFGTVMRSEGRVFVLRAEDLVLPVAGLVEPADGDEVREDLDGAVGVYRVVSLEGNGPFKYVNGRRDSIRLVTKFVGFDP